MAQKKNPIANTHPLRCDCTCSIHFPSSLRTDHRAPPRWVSDLCRQDTLQESGRHWLDPKQSHRKVTDEPCALSQDFQSKSENTYWITHPQNPSPRADLSPNILEGARFIQLLTEVQKCPKFWNRLWPWSGGSEGVICCRPPCLLTSIACRMLNSGGPPTTARTCPDLFLF